MPARAGRGASRAGGRADGSGPGGSGPGGASVRGSRRPGQSAPTTTRRTTRVEVPEGDVEPRRSGTFTSRALILLLVLAVLGVSYASSIRAWLNQRSEQHSLAAQIADQRREIAQLKQAKLRWDDPAYIEQQARLRFGWVMPGERSYRVIGKDGEVLSVGNDSLSSTLPGSSAAQPPWWDGAARSLVRADAPPRPAAPAGPSSRHPASLIGPAADHATPQ